MSASTIIKDKTKTLVPLDSLIDISKLDQQALPCDVYNSTGALVASKGQVLDQHKLARVFIYTPKKPLDLNIQESPEGKYFAQHPDYREESIGEIEKHLGDLLFTPMPKIKNSLIEDIQNIKNLYQVRTVNGRTYLKSEHNKQLSFTTVNSMDALLENGLGSSDYIDMISSIRNKNNYFSFSHVAATCFYTLSIMKKLRMLKEDILIKPNMGVWLSVKTPKNQDAYKPLPFSNQLLKYIDYQKNLIQCKYQTKEIKEVLFERLHDIMHLYGQIKSLPDLPSFRVKYDMSNRYMAGIAALNANIGKLFFPNQVLNKPAPLDDKEFALIKTHPLLSIKKLKEAKFNHARIHAYILGHHINSSSKSYPRINFTPFYESRIIALAELYDAMRSPRHYGKVYSLEEISAVLEHKYQQGFIDLPLYASALHTFMEFDREFLGQRAKNRIEIK